MIFGVKDWQFCMDMYHVSSFLFAYHALDYWHYLHISLATSLVDGNHGRFDIWFVSDVFQLYTDLATLCSTGILTAYLFGSPQLLRLFAMDIHASSPWPCLPQPLGILVSPIDS